MTGDTGSGWIKAAAAELGFERCGIATAAPLAHGDFLADWLAGDCAGTMDYLHRHRASRADVRAWLPWARSIIVVALNYAQPDQQTTIRNPQAPIVNRRFARGRVAMYAWGEDYHVVVREKLDALLDRMREEFGDTIQGRVCVDTSAIIERELAAAAGVGWIGKNTMVLQRSLGSFFVLGEIITDLVLPLDTPAADHCGTCTRCLDACPTAAFPRPYVMDARRCISYLTIEHRGDIDPDLAAKIDNWVFGCDLCQAVCPFNRRPPRTAEPRFHGSPDSATPRLADILAWDPAAYHSHVKGNATARAKLQMWQRNARIAKDNMAAAEQNAESEEHGRAG